MHFVKESVIHATVERVFSFHELPDAFLKLVPPWEDAKILQKADISVIGSRAIIETKILGLIPARWVAEHTAYDPPRYFEDVQVSGPFKSWRHRHIIEPHATGRYSVTRSSTSHRCRSLAHSRLRSLSSRRSRRCSITVTR